MRELTYAEAIKEALHQLMEYHEDMFQIGVGVDTPWYVGGTMEGLKDRFGEARIIDTPVAENSVTGIATGAAIAGLRPLLVFPRMDFMHYAMDQLNNHMAALPHTLGRGKHLNVTIRAMINRGGAQGAQHSQALHGVFQHLPGWRVVLPSTPGDAKGMLIAAMESNEPVMYIEDRWLYDVRGHVSEEMTAASLTRAETRTEGKDVTVVGTSFVCHQAVEAARALAGKGIGIEVVDLRCIKPIDVEPIERSVAKTGRLIVIDGGWRTGGTAAEVAALAAENFPDKLRCPVKRMALPDLPAPAAPSLEAGYYIRAEAIVDAVEEIVCARG